LSLRRPVTDTASAIDIVSSVFRPGVAWPVRAATGVMAPTESVVSAVVNVAE
jgi:hypothetical protein